MQQPRGIKRLFTGPLGLVVLGLVAFGTMVGSFLYLGPFIAIPTFLLFGLAVPIWTGWKRPRTLLLFGILVLLASAPTASFVDAQQFLQPSPAAASDASAPYGNGAPVIDQALVSPYSAAPGSVFQFTADLHPQNVPSNASSPLWVELFVSTCPGATGNSSVSCGGGYPFYSVNRTLPANLTGVVTERFNVTLNGTEIWWWQVAVAVHVPANATSVTWIFLDPQNGYGAVEGPVTGDLASTFGIIIVPITEVMFLYSGSVFLFGLLVYLLIKSREARRRAVAGMPPTPPTPPGPPSEGGSSASEAKPAAAAPAEKACPNCGAVVYPSESSCWKCGKALPSGSGAAPLPSSKP